MEAAEVKKLSQPLLKHQIYFMPKSLAKGGDNVYCQILAYKDARTDMEILDLICGADWQNEYKRDSKGVLQCGIGIFIDERNDWVWRWSNGTPSEFEKEKGEYSDALKRAGFMWGIGRMLYDFPSIRVVMMENDYEENNGKYKAKGWFKPNAWKWEIKYNGDDVESIKASQKFGNTWKPRFNSDPYAK